jgi:hypothetical protein
MVPFFPGDCSGVDPRSLTAPPQDILPGMGLLPWVIIRSLLRSEVAFTLATRPHQGKRAVRVRHWFFGVDLLQPEEGQYLDSSLELGVRHVLPPAAY